MRTVHRKILSATALFAMPLQALNADEPLSISRPDAPPAECEAYVAYDRDRKMPGYLLPTSAGAKTCIPFSTVAARPPNGYRGDFYVDEFSDAKLRREVGDVQAGQGLQGARAQAGQRAPSRRTRSTGRRIRNTFICSARSLTKAKSTSARSAGRRSSAPRLITSRSPGSIRARIPWSSRRRAIRTSRFTSK